MSWVQEFKEFVNRGNVIDLAVAVVLGAAFGAVVTSFVDDVLMQILAAVGGQPDFSSLTIDIGDGQIRYGAFLTALVSFLIIAWAVFMVVRAINRMQNLRRRPAEDEPLAAPTDVELLAEIRDLLAAQQAGGPTPPA